MCSDFNIYILNIHSLIHSMVSKKWCVLPHWHCLVLPWHDPSVVGFWPFTDGSIRGRDIWTWQLFLISRKLNLFLRVGQLLDSQLSLLCYLQWHAETQHSVGSVWDRARKLLMSLKTANTPISHGHLCGNPLSISSQWRRQGKLLEWYLILGSWPDH